MSYAYLASPYTHHDPAIRQARYEAVRDAVAWLMRKGNWVFSPILHCHDLSVSHAMPVDHVFWQQYDLAMIKPASGIVVLMLDGWRKSQGVTHEIKLAGELGKPIKYMQPIAAHYKVLASAPR